MIKFAFALSFLSLAVIVFASWDVYIDHLINASFGNIDKACIIGLDGGAKWTSDGAANALQMSNSEASVIAGAFKSKDFTTFANNGVKIGGVTYLFLREENDKIVSARKTNKGYLVMQSSKTAIVIAHIPEEKEPTIGSRAVDRIAVYFEGFGMK